MHIIVKVRLPNHRPHRGQYIGPASRPHTRHLRRRPGNNWHCTIFTNISTYYMQAFLNSAQKLKTKNLKLKYNRYDAPTIQYKLKITLGVRQFLKLPYLQDLTISDLIFTRVAYMCKYFDGLCESVIYFFYFT